MEHENPPSHSDIALWERALRNDWAIPQPVKREILQSAINLAIPSDEETIPSEAPREASKDEPAPREAYSLKQRVDIQAKRDRIKLGAQRVIVQYMRLNAEQARNDLDREKFEFLKKRLGIKDGDAADPAGGLTPAVAQRALTVINDESTQVDP